MSEFKYRLQLLLEHKEDAKKEAERELVRQDEQLRVQVTLLDSLKVRERELRDKREQARQDLLVIPTQDQKLLARDVQQRSEYVKELSCQIEQAKGEVLSQQVVVEEREVNVELAKEHLKQARRELEILDKHRSKQEERFLREQLAKEELALDEVGNVLYTTRRTLT
jgi:YscO-like protein